MKRSEITNTLLRLVGPLVFLAGMMACITIGEPLGVGLTWRNVVALCAIPWICGYAGYNMGWIKGQYAGWIKSRDEFRPNKMMERPEASDGDSWVETIRCPACGMINTAHVHFEDWMPFPA
ncbi:MAG: hypothetical protein EOM20_14635, partial [Spartobacteria bacterium]|nr:hypothetical protein [Spartobacteria bacterium]